MLNVLILTVVVLTGALLTYPRLANAQLWRATITPLASIIGSGFLILGPILDVNFGAAAPLAMAALCLVGWLFGSAVRFNIDRIDRVASRLPAVERLETIASALLAFAYIISVAYYLNLFGAFGVRLTSLNDGFHARLLTTAIFVLILIVGWTRGLSALERLEQVAVGVKLAIIAGLLFGLAYAFGERATEGELFVNSIRITGWPAITLGFGLIVTVQGFETSRYLGERYDAATRIRSMRLAQALSTAVYLIYIGLLAYLFEPGTLSLEETAIIDLMELVAPILPGLLIVAALSAQLSAAVADTSGSGGLLAEVSRGRIAPKAAYGILVVTGLALTWTADLFEIISYASRAFALYYAAQAVIAALSARGLGDRKRCALFASIALLGLGVALFGQAVE